MTHQDVCVYTCVARNYDQALMHAAPGEGLRFVCFTDEPAKLSAPNWEIRELQSPDRLLSGHDINRFHKFFPHRIFPQARWSIYVDGNIRIEGDVRDLVRRVEGSGKAFGAFRHPDGHDLKQEVDACGRGKFDKRDVIQVERQLAFYASEGLTQDVDVLAGYILVRDHHADKLPLAMSLWWSQTFEFCKRDQISLPYVMAKSGLPWLFLDDDDGIDPARIERLRHARPSLFTRLKSRILRRN